MEKERINMGYKRTLLHVPQEATDPLHRQIAEEHNVVFVSVRNTGLYQYVDLLMILETEVLLMVNRSK